MSQKTKQAKKIQQQESSIEEEITEIQDKKQMSGQVYYLVMLKSENETKKQWRSETQLKSHHNFQSIRLKFQLTRKLNKTTLSDNNSKDPSSMQNKQSKVISIEKETKISEEKTIIGTTKKIHIDKEKIKISSQQQQMSLDNFMGKIKTKSSEGNLSTEKVQESQNFNQLKGNIRTEAPMLNAKQKQEQSIQEQKSLSTTNEIIKSQPSPPPASKVSSMWLDKIKSINKVKGYEIKNGQILYQIEASDKNGQNFFIPPMSTDVVLKYDPVKLAGFLQDCLLRGYAEQAKTK